MANTQRPDLSSVFDDMLAKSKRQFDDLYQGRVGHGDSGARPSRTTGGRPGTKSVGRLDAESPAVRRLNDRFGNDWRFEIAKEQRDGDEAIVLCRLVLGKEGAVRTQFGRAKISQGPVVGASGGMRFKLNAAGAAQDEREAFRRATEAALMNCADLA